uniref:Uncharacterized protein n=1 Tax=Arundo donax TaxID=35708 RepID=A0A0A8ZVK1_ARUDO
MDDKNNLRQNGSYFYRNPISCTGKTMLLYKI